MKSNFLNDVLTVIQPVPVEVLSLADSKHIDAEVSKLPWNGLNIDWKNQQYQLIDLSPEGVYSSDSISPEIFRRFAALHGDKVVMMYSAYEPPVAIAVNDFVNNWFIICSNLTFLPKIILISLTELNIESPNIIEIDPMQFIKGHV